MNKNLIMKTQLTATIVFYKRIKDSHVYAIEFREDNYKESSAYKNMNENKYWVIWKEVPVVKITELQFKILEHMKEQSDYNNPLYGFSALGYREIANHFKMRPTSVSNAMRSLFKQNVFFDSRARSKFSDTVYFLANPYLSSEKGGVYEQF